LITATDLVAFKRLRFVVSATVWEFPEQTGAGRPYASDVPATTLAHALPIRSKFLTSHLRRGDNHAIQRENRLRGFVDDAGIRVGYPEHRGLTSEAVNGKMTNHLRH